MSDESSQKCVSVRGGLCVVALSYTGLGHGRKGDWGHVVAIVCGLARLHLRRNLAETLCVLCVRVCCVCARALHPTIPPRAQAERAQKAAGAHLQEADQTHVETVHALAFAAKPK